ncbi:hypothetical protein [Hyperthermus butylicus]|uniref:Uncharacterized protein n=1 Tax=Hyperthermus butylicus (strain DSM 5456 / JCM 9403 / PLM1-5) TaxID=415426 RepID=A2BMX2_HYPBU|nr:hypothetical protein [Hyperthermus butylicus]ABM81333.1 hypothetical protein Hbut_1511 [Hyperthermus butylicus DSM 5456]
MAAGKAKPILAAIVLFAAFAVIGYYAVKGSSYMDVSDVVKLVREAKVTVKGRLASLHYDQASRKLYLVLEGRDGSKLLAVADAEYIEKKYGPIQYLRWDPDSVVVEGVYDPATGTLRVIDILEGCHSGYSQPAIKD